MKKTIVINAVGLTPSLIGAHTPRLRAFADSAKMAAVRPSIPAVTCTVQSSFLTGVDPNEHGIVGNGWYLRDDCEVRFWRQSNKLVQRPKIWDIARQRDPAFTCANLFWWYNMYSSVDYAVTPRPMYPADGRKLPDVWTQPAELRGELQQKLGQFPLFHFWGPATSIRATQWIADAALHIDRKHNPTLTLLYLPHLDYCLQKYGPDTANPQVAADLRQLDGVVGQLLDHYDNLGAEVIVLSEYGITAVSRPVHINRALRLAGMIAVREELGRELLDAGASAAFAVADHQVAHVYVNDARRLGEVRSLLEKTPGVGRVLDAEGKRALRLGHPRSGELVALAAPDSWFTYYYWLDDARMPDFARTVDIHRKPGYDPAELFLDPKLPLPKLKIAWKLGRKMMGFRYLMDVIGTDASLVRGSHGLEPPSPAEGPLLLTRRGELLPGDSLEAREVQGVVLGHLGV